MGGAPEATHVIGTLTASASPSEANSRQKPVRWEAWKFEATEPFPKCRSPPRRNEAQGKRRDQAAPAGVEGKLARKLPSLKEAARPVPPDDAIGRLTRLDAIQSQEISRNTTALVYGNPESQPVNIHQSRRKVLGMLSIRNVLQFVV